MRITVFALAFLAFGSLIPTTLASQTNAPAVPDTGSTHASQAGTLTGVVAPAGSTALATSTYASFPSAANKPQAAARSRADMTPVNVSIPSIGLNDAVQKMGILKNGELAVPSGNTQNVGWYAAGTVPGQVGSAVFDAHVFAALKNLRNVSVGDSIYVTDADGTVLRFVVETTKVFKLGDLSANYLFNRADARRLTLITCAGQLTPDHSTYTERLVVSAVLAD